MYGRWEIRLQQIRNRDLFFTNAVFLFGMCVFWSGFSTRIYPGDLGDSRVALFWMEHWFEFFQGKTTFNNLPIFYPVTNTLSGSDAFLIQGILHSIFRFLTINIGTSFIITTVLVHALGSYSCVAISNKFTIGLQYKLLIISLYGTMTPFWLSRNHIQLLVFPMLGWVVFFLIKFIQSKKTIHLSISFLIFFSILLSAGYAIAFSSFYLIIFFLCLSLFVSPLIIVSRIREFFHLKKVLTASLISLPMIYLFSRLYLSKDTLIGAHSKAETLFYSPSATDLVSTPAPFNGVESSISLFSKLLTAFNSLPSPTGEFGGSFGFFTVSALLIIIILFLRTFLIRGWTTGTVSSKVVLLSAIALIMCYFIILKDGRGVNIWAGTFFYLPFFGGIRVISRFTLFASLIIPFLLGFSLWEIRKTLKRQKLYDSTAFVLSILLFVNQPAHFYGNFDSSEVSVLNEIDVKVHDTCASFYLLKSSSQTEDLPPWVTSGDALALATRTGVPTINGASSFFPVTYPAQLYVQDDRAATLSSLNSWVSTHRLSRVCLIEYSRTFTIPVKTTINSFSIFNG